MADYGIFTFDVKPHVPMCPNPEIEDTAKRMVIDFCHQSRVWRDTIEIPLVVGQESYRLRARGGRVEQILSAQYRNSRNHRWPVRHSRFEDLINTTIKMTVGRPQWFAEEPTGGRIRIYPAMTSPDDEAALMLYVVLVPERAGISFPDHLAEEWYEYLIHGILWKILSTAGRKWTNRAHAEEHRQEYFKGVNFARREQMTDGHNRNSTKMRRWV